MDGGRSLERCLLAYRPGPAGTDRQLQGPWTGRAWQPLPSAVASSADHQAPIASPLPDGLSALARHPSLARHPEGTSFGRYHTSSRARVLPW